MNNPTINNIYDETSYTDNGRSFFKKYFWVMVTFVILIIILLYTLFAKSTVIISINSDEKANYFLDDTASLSQSNVTLFSKFKRHQLVVTKVGYVDFKKDFYFFPYISKKIDVSMQEINGLDISKIVSSKIIDNRLIFMTGDDYGVYSVDKINQSIIDSATKNTTASISPENLTEFRQNNSKIADLNFLNEETEFSKPYNIDLERNLILFQMDQNKTPVLNIFDISQQKITQELKDVKAYSVYENKLYSVNSKNEVFVADINNLQTNKKLTKMDNNITGLWTYSAGFFVLSNVDANKSKIYALDNNGLNIKTIDEGIIKNFNLSKNENLQFFYNKLENSRYVSFLGDKSLKTQKLKNYFSQMFFDKDNYFVATRQRINNNNNLPLTTLIKKDKDSLFSFDENDLINNIMSTGNNIFIITSDRIMEIENVYF